MRHCGVCSCVLRTVEVEEQGDDGHDDFRNGSALLLQSSRGEARLTWGETREGTRIGGTQRDRVRPLNRRKTISPEPASGRCFWYLPNSHVNDKCSETYVDLLQ